MSSLPTWKVAHACVGCGKLRVAQRWHVDRSQSLRCKRCARVHEWRKPDGPRRLALQARGRTY